MRRCTAVLVTLLFLGSLTATRLRTFGQPVPRSTAGIASSTVSQRAFFGVMGRVARPGVYQLTTAHPKLAEIVRRAGGLADDASRTVRVVRNGRIAFQTYYTPRLTLTLEPGDLLMVDRGRTDYQHGVNDVRPAGQISSRALRSEVAAKTQIEVAFVGLIDRPVVLRLRVRDATVGRVVELLKQPATVINTTRLILPTRFRVENHPASLTPETPLRAGTVVVFSRAHLDTAEIPPLPKPIRREDLSSTSMRQTSRVDVSRPGKRNGRPAVGDDAHVRRTGIVLTSGKRSTGKKSTPAAGSTVPTQKKHRVRDLLKSARVDLQHGRFDAARRKALAAQREDVTFAFREDRPELILAEIAKRSAISAARKRAAQPVKPPVLEDQSNGPVLLPGHRESGDSSTSRSAVTLSGRNVPHRLSQLAPPNSASLLNNMPISSKPVLESGGTGTALSAANGSNPLILLPGDADAIGGLSEETAAAKPNQSSTGLVLLFVVGCGVLAVGLASALLVSMARTAVKTAGTERSIANNEDALEALIHNKIAICEEEVELPAELTLYGRPTGLRKLRIDTGREQLRGPHFPVAAETVAAPVSSTPPPAGLRVDPPQHATNDEIAGRRREPLESPQRAAVQRDVLDRVLSTVNKVTDA